MQPRARVILTVSVILLGVAGLLLYRLRPEASASTPAQTVAISAAPKAAPGQVEHAQQQPPESDSSAAAAPLAVSSVPSEPTRVSLSSTAVPEASALHKETPEPPSPAAAQESAASARMYMAHASLRGTEESDPDSKTNQQVLQSMVTKALRHAETSK